MTEQELVAVLDNFAQVIAKEDLSGAKEKRINFFSATKMLSLETKHSAFFAWLLGPQNEHCLNNVMLKKLLQKLFNYTTKADKITLKPCSNVVILGNIGGVPILSEQKLLDLTAVQQINVYTEKSTYNGKRIDILIDIVDTKTVIVIENKIDSSTHDNQLIEYEDYINSEYSSYQKKIFIYLSKFGELPYDTDAHGKRGSYNDKWCVLDYGEIRCVIEELKLELENNDKTKTYSIVPEEKKTLITIMEHYIQMVDTSILNTSPMAREKCKKLLADPKIQEALKIIAAYQKIPTPIQIFDYVCDYLGGLQWGNSKIWFYTQKMKDYFVNRNEDYNIYKLRCVCQPINKESKIVIYVDTSNEKNVPLKYTNAQEALLKSCGKPTNGTNPRLTNQFDLVLEEERGLEFDQLKSKLDSRLDTFKKKLDDFIAKHLI